MPRYAADTTVDVSKSRAEIEALLTKYGATEFSTGWRPGEAMVQFRLKDLTIRFVLPIPERSDAKYRRVKRRGYWTAATENQIDRAWEQDKRQRWRALALVVKAKLEAVECGISTLTHEFLAFIVLPNDQQFGVWFTDNFLPSIQAGQMPQLALPAKSDGPVIEAEIVQQ
jgi:hypothetical protein